MPSLRRARLRLGRARRDRRRGARPAVATPAMSPTSCLPSRQSGGSGICRLPPRQLACRRRGRARSGEAPPCARCAPHGQSRAVDRSVSLGVDALRFRRWRSRGPSPRSAGRRRSGDTGWCRPVVRLPASAAAPGRARSTDRAAPRAPASPRSTCGGVDHRGRDRPRRIVRRLQLRRPARIGRQQAARTARRRRELRRAHPALVRPTTATGKQRRRGHDATSAAAAMIGRRAHRATHGAYWLAQTMRAIHSRSSAGTTARRDGRG